jgi:hypothetical protein
MTINRALGGGVAFHLPRKKKCWEAAPMECGVKPCGQPENTWKSSDKFKELIDKYFDNGH